jgi:hypothetical protein
LAPQEVSVTNTYDTIDAVETHKWNGNQWLRFVAAWANDERPEAVEYTNYFKSAEVPNTLWTTVLSVLNIMPSDIITWSYTYPDDHNGASGHVVFAYGTPVTYDSDTLSLVVFDSSSSYHGDDTRTLSGTPCTSGDCGLGIGTIYLNHVDGNIVSVHWSSPTNSIVSGVGGFAIARALPLPSSSCFTRIENWSTIQCDPSSCGNVIQYTLNALNGVGTKTTPFNGGKNSYGTGKSCTCTTSCGTVCENTSFGCTIPANCDTYVLNAAGFPRYILKYGTGKSWYGGSNGELHDNWLDTGIGLDTPDQLDFHNKFMSLTTSDTAYFKKLSTLSEVRPADIISLSYVSSPYAHVMFAMGSATQVPGVSNTWELKVMDSATEGHCGDSRKECYNDKCGIGIGKVYFVTNGDGAVTKFYWSDYRWSPFPFISIAFTRILPPP